MLCALCYKVGDGRHECLTVYFQTLLLLLFIHKAAAAEFSFWKLTQHEHNCPGPFSYLYLCCNTTSHLLLSSIFVLI